MGVAHTKVTLLGHLSTGTASWSCSFATPPQVGATEADMVVTALAAHTLFNTNVWTAHTSRWAAATTLIGARASQVDVSGHETVSGSSFLTTPIAGTGSGAQLPPECAVVVSLRTTTPGPRGRGRMYLPGPVSNNLGNNGELHADFASEVADGMQGFVNAWNADIDTLRFSVASSVGGFVTAVSSVRVGNVVDSQRRRRWSIPEAYQSRGITP